MSLARTDFRFSVINWAMIGLPLWAGRDVPWVEPDLDQDVSLRGRLSQWEERHGLDTGVAGLPATPGPLAPGLVSVLASRLARPVVRSISPLTDPLALRGPFAPAPVPTGPLPDGVARPRRQHGADHEPGHAQDECIGV